MNASVWGGLPATCLPSAGALRVVLQFVYGNWAKPPYSLFLYVCVKLLMVD